ncbi:MAG TPA: hypothetical protein VK470_13400, partial [Bacteroidota bacterium]|nr:hypothetical protein [Bacteroidota bacterium]
MRTSLRSFIRTVLVFLLFVPASAQWVPTSGPVGGRIEAITTSPHYLFAGASPGGVFRSQRYPIEWFPVGRGIVDNMLLSLLSVDHLVFAGTEDGLFCSDDEGSSWRKLGTWSAVPAICATRDALGRRMIVMAVDHDGIWSSIDDGGNWTRMRSGTYTVLASDSTGKLYAGNTAGIIRSDNLATMWTTIATASQFSGAVRTIALRDSMICVGTSYGGVSISRNNGSTWKNIGLKSMNGHGIVQTSLAIVPDTTSIPVAFTLYAATTAGVFSSLNGDTTWTAGPAGLDPLITQCVLANDGTLYAGTAGGGVFTRVPSYPSGWLPANTGLCAVSIGSLAVLRNTVLAATTDGALFRSADNGLTWASVTEMKSREVTFVASAADTFYANSDGGLYYSADGGVHWKPSSQWNWYGIFQGTASNTSTYVFVASSTGVFRTNGQMQLWERADRGIPQDAFGQLKTMIRSFSGCDSTLFAWTDNGLYRSFNNGTDWKAIDT